MRKVLLLFVMLIGTACLFELQAQQMKVISFNIHSNTNLKNIGKNTWNHRAKAVKNMIEKEAPEVFGIQEAVLDQLSYIDRKFRDTYRRVGVARDNGITRGEHTSIYYDKTKLKILSYKTRWLSETPQKVSYGWDAKEKRIVTIAHFQVIETGKEFFYFNTHLERADRKAQAKEVELLVNMIQSEVPAGIPVILGGDMNSNIRSAAFDPLTEIGMEVARDIAPRTDYKNSYNAFGNGTPSMNDHFFVRDIEVNRFKTLNKSYGAPYISDHYPIMMIITF